MHRRLDRRGNLILAAAAIDLGAVAKNEVRNRPRTRSGGLCRLRLDPLVPRRVHRDGARLCVTEPMVGSDVCKHVGIGNVLCPQKVGIGDRYRETMLGTAFCCGLNERMSGLGRVGVKLMGEVQSQPVLGSVMP